MALLSLQGAAAWACHRGRIAGCQGSDFGSTTCCFRESFSGTPLRWECCNDELRHAGKNRSQFVSARASGANQGGGGGGGLGFLSRLSRVLQEKAKSDVDRIFGGVGKTREKLAVVDELLTYWRLDDAEQILEELEEALLVADFGPRTASKIVNSLKEDIKKGKLTTGDQIREALKAVIVKLLDSHGRGSCQLNFPERKPAVIMVVGVNGGGKTTTVGKLAHRLKGEGAKVLLAAGDTFRAAASEQLQEWGERSGCEVVVGQGERPRPSTVLSIAVKRAIDEEYDVLIADTSGRLHTNYNLMEELRGCKRALGKALDGAPHEVLLVLDGTTGLNMLPQAREFNQVVGITGFVLTKLDGTARGGCVASVVEELRIPVKYLGVGETVADLQPFDSVSFVESIFPSKD